MLSGSRSTRFLELASFFLPLAIYLCALCPTVHLGDSGELSTAAASLSLPHVPGYPLTMQSAHALCRLPLGSLAFRTNLFSALCAAMACWLLFRLILFATKDVLVAFAVTMAFAGGQTFMEQSLKIRTYPLNTALSALLIFLALLWRERRDRRYLFAGAFTLGLGLTNHQILLVAAVFFAVTILGCRRTGPRVSLREFSLCAALVALGLSAYLYLPLRALAEPVLNWGNPRDWPRFVEVLVQRQYAHKIFTADFGDRWLMGFIILKSLTWQTGLGIFSAALLGGVVLLRKDPTVLAGLLVLVLANIVLRVNYMGQGEFHQVLRYTITCTLAVALAAAFGLVFLRRRVPPGIFLALLALLAAWPVARSYARNDLSRHRVAEDYAKAALGYPETGYAIAVGGDNNVFPLWYLTRVERYREDVILLPKGGMDTDWILADIRPRLPAGALEVKEPYAKVPFPILYSAIENIQESGLAVYSLFSATDHAVEQQVLDEWSRRGSIVPCGLGFRFDGRVCDESIWERIPMTAYTETSIHHDHHTISLLGSVVFHLVQRFRKFVVLGEYDAAHRALDLAARVLPEDPKPAAMLYHSLMKRGEKERAVLVGEDLKRRFPHDPRVAALLNPPPQAITP